MGTLLQNFATGSLIYLLADTLIKQGNKVVRDEVMTS